MPPASASCQLRRVDGAEGSADLENGWASQEAQPSAGETGAARKRSPAFDRVHQKRQRYGFGDEGGASQSHRQVCLVVAADHHIGYSTFLETAGQVRARAVDELGIED